MKKIRIPLLITLFMGLSVASLGLFSLDTQQEMLSNFQGSYKCFPEVIYDPKSIEEVQEIVLRAAEQGKTLMTGNRKFASQLDAACAGTDQIQITLKNMNRIISFDAEAQSIRVEAGLRFNELNDFLRPQGLAINMVTELGTFTLGGMLGSGTHGSTLTKHSNMIADYVTSLTLVDGLGEVRTLTGELLNAARVNLGVLGVVVEMTLQLEPAFKVKAEALGFGDDSNLEQVILDIARGNYSANVAWFPGLGRFTATTYNEVSINSTGNAYNAQADISDTSEFFFGLLFNAAHEFPGTFLQCLAAKARYGLRSSSYFRDVDSGKIQSNPVGYSDKMQYFSCKSENSCIWDRLPIALQEVAIKLEELPHWIADTRAILASNPRTCFPLNGIYFRFGKASPSYLGMNAGQDTAYIGIEYALRQQGNAVPKNYFVNREIEQMSLRKYGARPHWGKNSVAIFEDMPSRYPKWNDFLAAKQTLDPNNLFTNPFWERIRGADALTNYLTSGCAARGECYCQTDAHCSEGFSCQAGAAFTDARVCR